MMRLLTIFICSLVCASAQLPPEMFLLSVPNVAAATTPPSSLVTNLVAYWRMDETSGVRNDSVGTNHLADSNTVGYATGLITNCSLFVSNNLEYLSAVPSPEINTDAHEWSLAMWVKLHTTNITQRLCGKYGVKREYIIQVVSQTRIQFVYYTNSSSANFISVQSTVHLSTNNWCFLCVTVNTNLQKNTLFLIDTVAGVSEWITNSWTVINRTTGDGKMTVGMAANDLYFDGAIDEVSLYKRSLSSNEIVSLFSAGTNGVSYPFTGY